MSDLNETEIAHEDDFDAAFEAVVDEVQGDNEIPLPPGVQEQLEAPAEDDGDQFKAEKYAEIQEERQTAPEIAYPQGWVEGEPGLVEAWKSLPQEIRAQINKRERDRTAYMHREGQKIQELYNQVAPMANVLKDISGYRQKWALEAKPLGVEEAIRQSVEMREYIKNTPNLELAKQFLKASGKGPEALIDTEDRRGTSEIQALREEIESLKNGRQQELQSQVQAQQESGQQQLSARALDTFYRFAQTRNAKGQLKYPTASKPGFAEGMGSLLSRRIQQVPGVPIEQHMAEIYAHMGGQIDVGNANSSSNNNYNRLRDAAVSGYGKRGSGNSPQAFDSYDDAFNATLEEFGLLE